VDDTIKMATGCLPQPMDTRVGKCCAPYTGARIPPGEWRSSDALKPYVPRGKCQRHVPSCNWHTTGKAYQTKYAFMAGTPGKYPEVSYVAGFAEDTGNDFNVGTMPLESIRAIAERGLFPVTPDLPEWYDRPRRFPEDAQRRRALFRADEWEQCVTREDVVSALLNNDPVNIGIDWWDSDANPGPTGHLPVAGRGGKGGHSVLACGVVMGYALSPSGVGILFNNHHGDSHTPAFRDERGRQLKFPVWGDDGFGVVPVERVERGAPLYGCWALRTVYLLNDDLDVPTPNFAE
jgi:hypothetical protein